MAKLYFYYSAMSAGKSTVLLQSSHNYRERGMNTLVLTSEVDQRAGSHARTLRLDNTLRMIKRPAVGRLIQPANITHQILSDRF